MTKDTDALRQDDNPWIFRDSDERPRLLHLGQQFGEDWANGRVAKRVTEIGHRGDGWFNAILIEFEPGGKYPSISQESIATTPDTIGSHFGNGGGFDPVADVRKSCAKVASDLALAYLDAKKNDGQPGQTKLGRWELAAAALLQCEKAILAMPPHPAPVDSDEAVRLLRGIVRLSEMGFEASMREPEEDGNYAVYNRAKAFLDGHPSSVALSDALRDIPDEVYRHIAESKDVAHARSRVADLVAQLPLAAPVDPVAGGEGLREALEHIYNLPGELNLANYDDIDVRELNENFIDAILTAEKALAALKGPAA